MSASTFGSLKGARELEAAGLDRNQAEASAKTMRDAASADLNRIATKFDLYHVARGRSCAKSSDYSGTKRLQVETMLPKYQWGTGKEGN